MKLTSKGYRVTKNGNVLNSVEKEALKSVLYLGTSIKENGVYYFLNRKQGEVFIYLP